MRMRPKLITGIFAAGLALSACGAAAGTPGGTPGTHPAPRQAAHTGTDTGFADLGVLAQAKRDATWHTAAGAQVRQPRRDSSPLTDQRDLGRVKRDALRHATPRSGGR